jgi:predicted extracellular nuclease
MLFRTVVVSLLALAPRVSIMEIQGASLVSPFAGDSVSTTGVVTRLARDGFYAQDPFGDANDATSDAVFVRSGANVLAGDEVRVVGVVQEYLPGGNAANLTTTEIVQPVVTRLRAGQALPAPTRVARGERFPGTAIAEGIAFYESLEGMRVCLLSPRVLQPAYAERQCWVAPDAVELSARGALAVGPGRWHPERVRLSSAPLATPLPRFTTGDVLSDVTGVMSYRAGNFELLLEAIPVKRSGGLSREISTLASRGGRVRVASFNLHNLGLEEPSRMEETARVIVSQLGAPEILGLVEVADDSGSQDDGVVDATQTLRALTSAIRDAGGPWYDFREVVPADGTDGGAPGYNIRPALLFDRTRVSFVDRGDASGDAETRVVSKNGHPELTRSPGRISPGNLVWTASRKPLACELRVDGSTLFVVVCHFVSKSRSSPLMGAVQPPTDPDASKRRRQAELVADFVGDALAIDPDAGVVVLGDMNDDWFSATIAALEAAPLTNLWRQVDPLERYTYIFDGNAQALDHVLVTTALAGDARFDVVHVGAEFPEGVSDHDCAMALLRVGDGEPAVVAMQVSQPVPNPFTGAVTVLVEANNAVRAAIFDVAGKRVCSLGSATVLNGSGTVSWGGHDDAGREVPAGVYWVRVSDGVSTRARKVVLIR